jgi:hypothetical protein
VVTLLDSGPASRINGPPGTQSLRPTWPFGCWTSRKTPQLVYLSRKILSGKGLGELFSGLCGNEPFGSRPEPGAYLIASILLLPPGEVPEGRARVDQQPNYPCASAQAKAREGTGRHQTSLAREGMRPSASPTPPS